MRRYQTQRFTATPFCLLLSYPKGTSPYSGTDLELEHRY